MEVTSPIGLVGPPVLDGSVLDGAALSREDVREKKIRGQTELANGDLAEGIHWTGPAGPMEKNKYTFILRYDHLRDCYDLVEDTLAGPPPYTFVPWRLDRMHFRGNGSRTSWALPRKVANHVAGAAGTPPDQWPEEIFAPRVRVGKAPTSPTLTPVAKSQEDYDDGDPAEDEAWFVLGGQAFKVLDPPGNGVRLVVAYCPVFVVTTPVETSRSLSGLVLSRESADIELREK